MFSIIISSRAITVNVKSKFIVCSFTKMDVEEFRERGKEMVDYICEYLKNIGSQRVRPLIEPGYLGKLVPHDAPEEPEEWKDIMYDVEKKIMLGITHWQHPRFHAYFPAGNSFPSILGDMLSDAIGCIGFSWDSSPACTELETIVLDWLGKAIGLPNAFIMSSPESKGGGVLQSSASDCMLLAMLTARNEAIKFLKTKNPEKEDSSFLPQLIAYCSKESHSCVEKSAKILLIKLQILDPDDDGTLRGSTLKAKMEEDKARGLLPFFVAAVLGSTSSCSFDNLSEIGPVCAEQSCCWLHVDAAYAGSAFICPELRHFLTGVEHADSFDLNPNKWLLVNFDCSCLWVRDKARLIDALMVNPIYLQHANEDEAVDYRHWGIPLSRRFRSLKLWFVIRKYGLTGLRSYIRNHIKLAQHFEQLVKSNAKFKVMNNVRLGLVCFRLVASESATKRLLDRINSSGKLHLTPARIRNEFVIRFCVNAENAKEEDIKYAWDVIKEFAALEKKVSPREHYAARPRLTRQKTRFTFVRTVSKEVLLASMRGLSLSDLATPVFVAESDEEDLETEDEVFEK